MRDAGTRDRPADGRVQRTARYDPIATLNALDVPSFWLLGEKDRSIPLQKTVATLEQLAADRKRPITTHVLPALDHGLRNVVTGEQPDFWRLIAAWLLARHFLTTP